ncbi:type I restriction endonuclease subunit R [Adlercreutzia mucosicola]|uniref:type I restriction endonuclease subunit R n=1 Tax=Adlercreutzia mucosicola TaxID=580026 RepID=UPI000419A409|nr:type I restriction endonuclease subunit R [Adlercreutzia mucosicola]MCR2035150.1 type I restriction endonuclease subunit R [Adlercreutzia mucosicola]
MTEKIEHDESGSGVEYAVVSTSIEIPEESLVDNLSGDVTFDVMAFGGQSTVCSSAPKDTKRSSSYQSEARLEDAFIKQLRSQGYGYLAVNSEEELIANLRKQLELLNKVTFSDKEWERMFNGWIASDNEGIVEKTRRIQQDHVYPLRRDDGTVKNIQLLDKRNVYNNRLQVMNQYTQTGNHENRYDVTILVNGLPLVHVELKRRGIAIEEAFNQIERYQRDSFWSASGLFEYVQLFVISNGTHTKYYSNTTRFSAIEEAKGSKRKGKKTSNSFKFTSWWAAADNVPIYDLVPFTSTFFAKHALLSILTKYCVFDVDEHLLVMRPYQIVATERILNRILVSENDKKMLGTLKAGGYIWHTTGSGKTLTSFKTAQLASAMDGIDKVMFVVDRKDLDYQTMKEYDRFEKGAVDGSESTAVLTRQLADPNCRILVTTIQKLSNFIKKNKKHEVYDRHCTIIFDECHRSQFGDMHKDITKHFKNYHLFGFTGTPIFAENARSGGNPRLRTTEQAFGDKLHTYTIVDAIRDENVLPFRIDYIKTIKKRDEYPDEKVYDIHRQGAYQAAERVGLIVNYILDHYAQKTKRDRNYLLKDQRVMGFNSIFATASIPMAKVYYSAFKRLQEERGGEKLKIALIYSFGPNESDDGTGLPDESFDMESLDTPSRDFLDAAIDDYNEMFSTSFDTSSLGFQNYYKDVSERLKNRELDMVIVVNMFLTGFDATTLNTLWVDKDLKDHGLIQAFSRTNRILNSVKTYGNIVCFRNLEDNVNHAISLFGDKDAGGIVLLKPYGEYLAEYQERLVQLYENFPLGEVILGEQAEKDFIRLFGVILRLRNILTSFDDFAADDTLSPRDEQDYRSIYQDLHNKWRPQGEESTIINDDLVFEIELLKQVDVNIDYILMLVQKYHDGHCQNKVLIADIERAIKSSYELRNKKDLIDAFIDGLESSDDVTADWERYIAEAKKRELSAIVEEENLDEVATEAFVRRAFADGEIEASGTNITNLMNYKPSRFAPDGQYSDLKNRVIARLKAFLERFKGLS